MIAAIIVGKASTKLVSSSIPASIICGIASSKKSTIEMIIYGSDSIKTGIAVIIPSASPFINFKAASSIKGKLSTSVFTS